MPQSASSEQALHCLHMFPKRVSSLTLLHSKRPKLYTILAFLSAIGLKRVKDSREIQYRNDKLFVTVIKTLITDYVLNQLNIVTNYD